MSSGKNSDDVQAEYDLAKLGKATRGKYFKRYQARSDVAIDGDDARPRRKPKAQRRTR